MATRKPKSSKLIEEIIQAQEVKSPDLKAKQARLLEKLGPFWKEADYDSDFWTISNAYFRDNDPRSLK